MKTAVYNNENGLNCSEIGETIKYTFVVSNEGNVPLSNVIITDALFAAPNPEVPIAFQSGDTDNNELLDVSELWEFTASYSLVAIDLENESVYNQATVTAFDTNNISVNDLSDDTSIFGDDPTITILPRACYEIIAIDDFHGPIAGVNEEVENILNIFENDILNDDPVVPSEVTLTLITPEPNGYLELNPDGSVDLVANTPPGSYQLTYQICEIAIPTNCDTAVVTVVVEEPQITINTLAECIGDTPYLNYDVTLDNFTSTELLTVDWLDNSGNVVATFTNLPLTGRMLWPGAILDANGIIVDWPGWVLIDGVWVLGDDGFQELRPTADVRFSINPVKTVTVNYPPSDPTCSSAPRLDANFTQDNVLCNDTATGAINVTVSGGIAPYTYVWSTTNGSGLIQGLENQTDLTAGDYEVIVTDSIGDQVLINITITETEPLLATIEIIPATDGGDCQNGEATVNASGGTLPYTYLWSASAGNQTTATATSLADGQHMVTVIDANNCEITEIITVECSIPELAIVKTGLFNDLDGDGCTNVGETITYSFVVTNQGNVSISAVAITDALLGGLLTAVASGDADNDNELDVTETWIYEQAYVITQADIDLGYIENQATVTGEAPDGSAVSDLSDDDSILGDDVTVTSLCQNNDIALIKTGLFNDLDGDGCANVGETITYSFEVVNNGNTTLTSVTIEDLLVNVLGGPIVLAAGATDNTSFVATYFITQLDIDAGEFTNQAIAQGITPDGTLISDLSDDDTFIDDDPTVTALCQNGDIALIKVGTFNDLNGDGCANVGETISYTFSVTNQGNVTLSNISITDPLVIVTGAQISLTPGQTDINSFTAIYTVLQSDIDTGSFINQATAEGTTPGGILLSDLSDDDTFIEDDPTVTVLCQNGDIALIKVGTFDDLNGDGCADVGDLIRYEFTVYNLGNVTLTNVDITDPLVVVLGGPIALLPQAIDSTSFSANYSITQSDIDAGFVLNQALVEGTTPSSDIISDLSDDDSILTDDPTTTVLCQDATIALVKTAVLNDENGSGCMDVGETILYNFSVTNLGNVDLINISITDPIVNVSGGAIILEPGATDSDTFTAVYVITQDDVDVASVTNQATAEGTAPDGTIVFDLSDPVTNNGDDPTITEGCNQSAMSVLKSGVFNDDNDDDAAQVGEVISYLFSVTNTGTTTLYNITIDDPLPGIVIMGGPIGVLFPGETDDTTFTANYLITQADIDTLSVANQAIATGQDPLGNEVTDLSDDPNNPDNEDANNDGEPDDVTITLIPNVLAPFEIYNGITPDDDGKNDFFLVQGISNWPTNNVQIFNRWGVLVFETDGYGGSNDSDNVFAGLSEGRVTIQESNLLPSGTYYYIINFPGDNPGKSSYAGYLYLNR